MLCVPDCARPLGLEDNKNQIGSPARLNGPSAWCTSRTPAYLQIDLNKTYKLTAIATQGETARNKWIQRYRISFYAGKKIVDYSESGSRKVIRTSLIFSLLSDVPTMYFNWWSSLLNKTTE